MADPPKGINQDETSFTRCPLVEQGNCRSCSLGWVLATTQQLDSSSGKRGVDTGLTLPSRSASAKRIIGIRASANDCGIAHTTRMLVKDPTSRGGCGKTTG